MAMPFDLSMVGRISDASGKSAGRSWADETRKRLTKWCYCTPTCDVADEVQVNERDSRDTNCIALRRLVPALYSRSTYAQDDCSQTYRQCRKDGKEQSLKTDTPEPDGSPAVPSLLSSLRSRRRSPLHDECRYDHQSRKACHVQPR